VIKRLWPAAIALLISGLLHAQGNIAPVLVVRDVRFENITHLSDLQKTQLSDLARQSGARPGVEKSIEDAVQTAYADRGYWRAKIKATIVPADGQADVAIRALEEGRQYKLGQIRWIGVASFKEADLAELVPLHSGRILERSKIDEGMDAVRSLYMGGGYLSYVATPEVEVNELDGTAELRINVNEGGLYTVQGFDVIGVNPALRTRLLQAWPFKPGDVYRGENVENFISANAALLPTVVSSDVVCRTVDLSTHTVEFVLDFRPPGLACNGPQEIQVTSNR
jgi:outer membrane protein assembly factor BamA